MTATLYPSPQHDQPTAVHGDEIDYGLRRVIAAVVVLCVAFLLAIAGSAVVGAITDIGGSPAAASDVGAGVQAIPTVHVAEAGDTLWSIADQYRGPVAQGRFVDALVDLNGGAAIQVGQAVRLP